MRTDRSKYNVLLTEAGKAARTYGGRLYDSKREAAHAATLDLREASGEIAGWTPKPRIPLIVDGQQVCVHVLDFHVVMLDGSIELHEVKGFETDVWTLKRKLLEITYLQHRPEITYRIFR